MLVEAHSMSMAFFTCHIAHFYPFVRIKKGCIFVQCSKLSHISKIL